MGIHYDYKSTRGEKAMKKEAKKKARLELRRAKKLKDNPNILLVSFSVTPEIDSVEQLKKYALEKNVIDSKWSLLTGNKKEIYDLARKSYLVAKDDGDGGKYDMIHTENFVLIDKEKRIRGFYDGTNDQEMTTLLSDIKILESSY